jgi:hypothetical protein
MRHPYFLMLWPTVSPVNRQAFAPPPPATRAVELISDGFRKASKRSWDQDTMYLCGTIVPVLIREEGMYHPLLDVSSVA